ncbi:DEAD/DEAH box helicase [Methylophilus sp. 14]|uniref:DEAD/DEAH box helicase n=1 Tax=Methylophilus sp. 14 TaxID=2781019 RepID=UPI00188EB976|nr:ATP-binding domain-containing protein [Methylophilus sp. 14]MBF4987598.1 DEAD/DEAH box helicase [Methylophilus sp. 14]
MSGYCFFEQNARELTDRAGLTQSLEELSEQAKKQTYVLSKPLTIEDTTYDYDNAVVVFVSGMRPFFLNLGEAGTDDSFNEYTEEFIDDISFLSEKYKYREKIGRRKNWENCFISLQKKQIDFNQLKIENIRDIRTIDLIISLVVGSINDTKKINLETVDSLDAIKSKIILFDTDQTSFVFKNHTPKKLVIQGLAGSGKTELLLHKLKEIYSKDIEAKIAFTCFNKILASTMRIRIPDFFDFMRVERQIDWNNKLFCFHSWGSGKDPNSGMYRHICHSLGIPFRSLMAGNFDAICKLALEEIKASKLESTYVFDYVFIDESQDFAPSFIELCELVTRKKIFVAGDVFQNIFRAIDDSVNKADIVLKKCYRTDPKNLMFSHALGMGLYEKPVLRWLKDEEWNTCGYTYHEAGNGRAILSREPLRRFEDIPVETPSTYIHQLEQNSVADQIISIVSDLRHRFPSIQPGDIAVIYLDKDNYVYNSISELEGKVKDAFKWPVNVSYETKSRSPDKFFISNINNAKGLEFPFVICYASDLYRQSAFRNGLYTMMARSFLESHLVLSKYANQGILKEIKNGLDYLTKNNRIDIRIPSAEEIKNQKDYIILENQFSVEKLVKDFCAEKTPPASPRLVAKLISRMNSILNDTEDLDEDIINNYLKFEYEVNKKL